jgi:sortase A
MRDRRPVDELSIDELERVLAIRKREERMQRLERMRQDGRIVETHSAAAPPVQEISKPVHANGAVAEASRTPAQQSVKAPAHNKVTEDASPRFEEDIFAEPRHDDPVVAAKRRNTFNRILLGVEVAAVFGLLFIGVNMALSIGKLERETQAAQEAANQSRIAGIPTMAPTSVLTVRLEDYVLPGGHIVEAGADGTLQSRFNFEEFIEDVPAHLQVAVQQQALSVNITRPPETPETALYISIPRLGIDQSIVQGTDEEALRNGIGQVLNGAYPAAETGNVVFAAHNDIYAQLFKDLDKMQIGDEFTVQTRSKTFVYRVTGHTVVDPTDVYVMDNQGRATATLISCWPFRVNNKRYVVFAERIDGTGI